MAERERDNGGRYLPNEERTSPDYIQVEQSPQFLQLLDKNKQLEAEVRELRYLSEQHEKVAESWKKKYEDCKYSSDTLQKDLNSTQYDLDQMRKLYEKTSEESGQYKYHMDDKVDKLNDKVVKYKSLILQLNNFIYNEVRG